MCQFQFLLAPKVRYDPLHIISSRKKRKTNEALEHVILKGLECIANNEEVLEGQSTVGLLREVPGSISKSLVEVIQTPAKEVPLRKRNASAVEAMDVDEPSSLKWSKLKGKEIVGQDEANPGTGKEIICTDADDPPIEFSGTLIENELVTQPADELVDQPAGESVDQSKQQETTIVPPIQMKNFVFGKTEDAPFKSLKELMHLLNH